MFFILLILYTILFFVLDNKKLAYYSFIVSFSQVAVLVFNFFRLPTLERLYLFISNVFIAYLYSGLLGPASGMSLFYYPAFIAPIMRFSLHEKWQIITCYIVLSTVIILDWYFNIHIVDTPIFSLEEQINIKYF